MQCCSKKAPWKIQAENETGAIEELVVKPGKTLWETGVQNMVTELLEFKMLQESGLSDKNRGACSDHASGMNERLCRGCGEG